MKKSTGYLDLLRFLSTFLVIIMHTVSGVTDNYWQTMDPNLWTGYTIIKGLCSIAVPVFLMISSVLFLNPDKEIPLKTLFTKYIRRIFLVIVIFGTLFVGIEMIFTLRMFNGIVIYESVRHMLIGQSWGHMWYLYMLLGTYLLLPLFRLFSKHATKEVYRYTLIVLFIMNTIIPMVQSYIGENLGLIFPVLGVYTFLFLAGFYIHTYVTPGKVLNIVAIVVSLISACYIAADVLLKDTAFFYQLTYDNPFIVLFALSVFYLFSNSAKEYKISKWFRPYLFGIYLFHAVFLNLLYKAFHILPTVLGGYILIPVFVVAVFVATFATVWVLRLIPPLKKYLL